MAAMTSASSRRPGDPAQERRIAAAARAFSSEVDTGSREENASKQKTLAFREGLLEHKLTRLAMIAFGKALVEQ
jgi:hypothetical protein